MRGASKWISNRATTSRMSTTSSPVWLLLLLCGGIEGQRLVYARDQRSLYGPSALGWNSVGGFNPIGLGHMTKDELLTLLEAWQDVEGDAKPEPAEPAAPPTPPPPPPRPPPPPPQRPASPAPAPAPPQPAPVPGEQVTLRLPAFVPIQLAAMFTPPGPAAAADTGVNLGIDDNSAEVDMIAQSGENAAPRLFRLMQLPMNADQPLPRSRAPQPQLQPQLQVMRNTLESVDSGLAPLANLVKAKAASASAQSPKANLPMTGRQMPPFRNRFALPPFLANAPGRLELVPSSQIIGDWRE